ncbi:MAG: FecR family protein [Kiritimatiellae bacterium]|nr:FecR family protein [Kiritimatiellia bacterium]MDD5519310.1 FecR family protein [Kiritimatiellia bacterium]
MKKWMIVAIFFSCFLTLPRCMAADNSIGQIIAVEGQVKATGTDGRERRLDLKSDVFTNDRIVTAAGAKLQIQFNDDTMISQGEKSEMTIDQYVYNPKARKDDSCSFRMMKGVFRTITGKITEINPERFKVKTNLATIGIRGCELGFRLQANREDIYVISLPPGDSIVIEKIVADETGKGGVLGAADRILNIINEGVAVTISASASLVERPIPASEGRQLINDSTPSKSAGGGGDVVNNDVGSQNKSMRSTVDEAREKMDESIHSEEMLALLNASKQHTQKSKSQSFTEPTSAPYVPPPDKPPFITNGGTPMGDWAWGLWADGSVEIRASTENGAAFLSAAEYQSIISSTPNILLTGSGSAAAVVTAGSYKNTSLASSPTTPITFEVMTGPANPAWGAIFNLTGGGDSLSFEVTRASGKGKIDAGGNLSLDPAIPFATYTLLVNGTTLNQGSLTAQSMNGTLIKPGMGTPPISGVAGSFSFQHGSAASASGAFGADLN